jgi:hypothetical protein
LFLLVFRGVKTYWELPYGTRAESPLDIVEELQRRWTLIADRYPGIEDVKVIGIDLKERDR